MNQVRSESIVEVLTRSGPRRDVLLGQGNLSDEYLIREIAGEIVDTRRLKLLAGVSQLLRLMDSLITSKETGASFAAKFSYQWLLLREWNADPILDSVFEEMNEYYSAIQLFNTSEECLREEPSLFGLQKLNELTIVAYDLLLEKWRLSLFDKTF